MDGPDAYVEWDKGAGAPEAHMHGHGDSGNATKAPMPEPVFDQTLVPQGDLGFQLDVRARLY